MHIRAKISNKFIFAMFGNRMSVSDYYRGVSQNFDEWLLAQSLETLTDEELLKDFKQRSYDHFLTPIEFNAEKEEEIEFFKEVRRVPSHMRDHFYANEGDTTFEYEGVILHIPLVSHGGIPSIVQMETSTMSMSWTYDEVTWRTDEVVIKIDTKGYGFKKEEGAIQNDLQWQKDRIREHIDRLNSDILAQNKVINEYMEKEIEARRQKLESDNVAGQDLASKLGYKIRQ